MFLCPWSVYQSFAVRKLHKVKIQTFLSVLLIITRWIPFKIARLEPIIRSILQDSYIHYTGMFASDIINILVLS